MCGQIWRVFVCVFVCVCVCVRALARVRACMCTLKSVCLHVCLRVGLLVRTYAFAHPKFHKTVMFAAYQNSRSNQAIYIGTSWLLCRSPNILYLDMI